jgi:hypothetical protein
VLELQALCLHACLGADLNLANSPHAELCLHMIPYCLHPSHF